MGKGLRIVAIILIGLTALQTLLGAVGSICISWFPEKYESLVVVAPYKRVYQVATIFTFIAAGLTFAATYALVKGRRWGYRIALLALLLGLATAGTKMYFSSKLRGSTAPTNIRFYLTIVTLLYFLLLKLPTLWAKANLEGSQRDGPANTATGITLIVGGLVAITTPLWAGDSHTMNGFNLVLVLKWPLLVGGSTAIVWGIMLLSRELAKVRMQSTSVPQKIEA